MGRVSRLTRQRARRTNGTRGIGEGWRWPGGGETASTAGAGRAGRNRVCAGVEDERAGPESALDGSRAASDQP